MNKTIGEWLADEIQKAGVSQAEVARRSGGQLPAVTPLLWKSPGASLSFDSK